MWIIVCIQKPSHHVLQALRPLCMSKIVFRDSSLYPKQSLFCLVWLISANFTETLVWKTWIWREIMTSQTTHTKYKWHHTPLNETPIKFFWVRHWARHSVFSGPRNHSRKSSNLKYPPTLNFNRNLFLFPEVLALRSLPSESGPRAKLIATC